MDKLTKGGDDHVATETLKAYFRTFLWSESHFALLAVLEMSLGIGLAPTNWIVSCREVVLCIKQLRFYVWLRKKKMDIRRVLAAEAIKSFHWQMK